MRPEQRGQTASVSIVQTDNGIAVGEHPLEEEGVDVHQGGLQQCIGPRIWMKRRLPAAVDGCRDKRSQKRSQENTQEVRIPGSRISLYCGRIWHQADTLHAL